MAYLDRSGLVLLVGVVNLGVTGALRLFVRKVAIEADKPLRKDIDKLREDHDALRVDHTELRERVEPGNFRREPA